MKNLSLPLVLAGAMLLCACGKEDGPSTGAPFGEATDIIVNLVNDTPSRALDGTQPGQGDENKLTALEFFVFNDTGAIPDPAVGEGNGYLKITTSELSHRIRVSSGTGKIFLVVANSDIGEPSGGEKFEDILKKITLNTYPDVPTASDNPRIIPAKGFEMSGWSVVNIGSGSTNQVYITLTRTVSRISSPVFAADVPVEIKTQDELNQIWDEQWGIDPDTKISFELDGFAVVNGAPKSNIAFVGNSSRYYKDPVGDPWTAWVSKGNINSDFDTDGSYNYNYSGQSGVNTADWFLLPSEGPVYVYETMPEEMSGPGLSGYDPVTVYAYIIKGTLKPEASTGAPEATRYWRVDLTKDDYYHIMRNCVYKVSINKISTPGYGTPEEAEDPGRPVPPPGETSADFFISVAQWDINKYETEM